jgi:RNA polymerase sigma factor (sigma-70 family)
MRPFAMKMTQDVEDANDLLQDSLVKAITNRDKFSEGTNVKAWFYTIMRNTFITNYQKIVRRKTFTDSTENLYHLNSADNLTDNQANTSITMKEIRKEIDKLASEFKTPFMMYFNGYKYNEIADMLEIPIGTVKNRIHIARKELKDTLSSLRYYNEN